MTRQSALRPQGISPRGYRVLPTGPSMPSTRLSELPFATPVTADLSACDGQQWLGQHRKGNAIEVATKPAGRSMT